MSIYHLEAQIISRRDGGNAVAAAAYRSASRLTDEATGIIHDFRRKRGVAHTEIMGPPNAPEWIYDRQILWNAVESIERRRDAQLARELEIALPVELSLDDHVELIHRYVRREFIAAGMIVDIAVHRDDIHNPHAHLMLSTRGITAQGFGPKEPAWNETENPIGWRREWADLVNAFLAKIGVARFVDHRSVDHRSLDVQGIARSPPSRIDF
jgi:ATP-dependent exoDNAse (exonuclease V) alpha subunit